LYGLGLVAVSFQSQGFWGVLHWAGNIARQQYVSSVAVSITNHRINIKLFVSDYLVVGGLLPESTSNIVHVSEADPTSSANPPMS
jgi:hypothetical protein